MASKNPRNNDNLRRVQAVLNNKYSREARACKLVDELRAEGIDDRTFITDALLLLKQRRDKTGYTPNDNRVYATLDPASTEDVQLRIEAAMANVQQQLVDAVVSALTHILSNMTLSTAGGGIPANDVRSAAENAVVSTFNLVGNSMRYDPSEDEE